MTMTKKRLILFAAVPLTFTLTLCVLAMIPPRPGVTKANFDRIQEGMTLAEVQELFGRPPDFSGEIGQDDFVHMWNMNSVMISKDKGVWNKT
jgi:hypothetical protein